MRKPAAKAQLDDEYSIADRAWELLDASDGPDLAEDFGLLEDELRCALLLVGRVAVLAENPLDDDSQVGSNVFANGPVDCQVASHSLHEVLGDHLEDVVALPTIRSAFGTRNSQASLNSSNRIGPGVTSISFELCAFPPSVDREGSALRCAETESPSRGDSPPKSESRQKSDLRPCIALR